MKEIRYSKKSLKFLSKQEANVVFRIREAIADLDKNLHTRDVKILIGSVNQEKRLRVGKYRVIFREKDNKIFVDDIGSRGDIYK